MVITFLLPILIDRENEGMQLNTKTQENNTKDSTDILEQVKIILGR
ncbi:hypothetical protein ACFOU0_09275 [Salinicoccus sesuvii]|uniref:Uncharacterized protein n=1 Tax=Salinicoccus sesuvii TaxID=868281 RepID=A0ABV7N665_9STAP